MSLGSAVERVQAVSGRTEQARSRYAQLDTQSLFLPAALVPKSRDLRFWLDLQSSPSWGAFWRIRKRIQSARSVEPGTFPGLSRTGAAASSNDCFHGNTLLQG